MAESVRFSRRHLWVARFGAAFRLGVSDFLQRAVPDSHFVELTPRPGDRCAAGQPIGLIASGRSDYELRMPVSAEVTAVNEDLLWTFGAINADPYGAGWIAEGWFLDPAEYDALMDVDTYDDYTRDWARR
ncbi:glycine cleavage system protein H [Embleya sp. NBC_00896]|uniref:glycine cleavage system protein H n=1 Tax=Embleya sp. NBC_00896 TaxID=2975961 RepID=UPI00386FEF90|nr:glycine cleavage system protein H [Embleya sp. NBC_00896]